MLSLPAVGDTSRHRVAVPRRDDVFTSRSAECGGACSERHVSTERRTWKLQGWNALVWSALLAA